MNNDHFNTDAVKDTTAPTSSHSADTTTAITAITSALSHPLRVKIMRFLTAPDDDLGDIHTCYYVSELVDRLHYSQPLVSQHLAKLTHAGLVQKKRIGRNVFYYATHPVKTREFIDYVSAFAQTMSE